MKLVSPAFFLILALCLTGCNKPQPEAAKKSEPQKPAEAPEVTLKRLGYSISAADLVTAAGNGETEVVRLLLDAKVDPNSQDNDDVTALIRASEAGQTSTVKLLLERGAEPDRPGRESWTALMSAAYYNRPEVVALLLEKGANPALKDVNHWSALMKAVHQGNVESVKLIAPYSKDQLDRALMLSALTGKAKVVEALLDAGANVNARIEKDQTALMYAAMKGQIEAVKVLLAHDADPLAISSEGSTASIMALEKGYVDISKLIDAHIAEHPATAPTPAAAAATPTPEAVVPAVTPTPEAMASATPAEMPPVAVETPTPAPASATPTPQPEALAETSGTPSAPPDVAHIDPNAPAMETASAKQVDEEYKIWAASFQIDATNPATANEDPDADGFSNREEFEARTAPNDGESHPTRAARLKMLSYKGDEVPFVLQTLGSGKATLRRVDTGTTVEVSRGDKVEGLPYRVTSIQEKSTTDKNGQRINISEVKLVNMNTGSSVALLPDLPARSPESFAVLQVEGTGEKINVRQDQVFTLPSDRATKLKVMDLRPKEVVLQVVSSGDVVTIGLQPE